jgi:hypothetical protein
MLQTQSSADRYPVTSADETRLMAAATPGSPASPAVIMPGVDSMRVASLTQFINPGTMPREIANQRLAFLGDAPGPMVFSAAEQRAVGVNDRHRRVAKQFYALYMGARIPFVHILDSQIGKNVASQFAVILACLERRILETTGIAFALPIDMSWAERLKQFMQDYTDIDNPAPPSTPHNVRVLAMRFVTDQEREVINPAMLERYRFEHYVLEVADRKHYIFRPVPGDRGHPEETDATRLTLQRTGRDTLARTQWFAQIGVGANNRKYPSTTSDDGFQTGVPGWGSIA